MTPRRFQYKDSQSDKFWEIRVGRDMGYKYRHFVKFGKVGTNPHSNATVAKFATGVRCVEAAEGLIKQKLAKGYVETTPVVYLKNTNCEAIVSHTMDGDRKIAEHFRIENTKAIRRIIERTAPYLLEFDCGYVDYLWSCAWLEMEIDFISAEQSNKELNAAITIAKSS